MSTIPSNLARVPNLLVSQVMLSALQRTNQSLLGTQIQLASGRRVNRPSDDALATGTISVLDDIIERRDQRLRNLSHGESVLGNLDAALADASDQVQEARGIGLSQIGIGSDAETRATEALVIDATLDALVNIANRQYQEIFFFGGDATARPPVVGLLNGVRYQGEGDGLSTDIGLSPSVSITIAGDDAFGSLSARVEGERDLDPIMLANTRLVDLSGARGFGIARGSINVDVGGTDVTVDLTNAHTVQDVIDALNAAIQPLDAAAVVDIDPAPNNRLRIMGNTVDITMSDFGAAATAADLGVSKTFVSGPPWAPPANTGVDLNPKLTELTAVSSLSGVTVPMGTIRTVNAGQSRDLDLSGATTVQDIMNAVEGLNLGVRVEIAETGDRLNFINELSGGQMGLAEVAGGMTATELGVRSFTGSTELADFNRGLGVEIRTGSVDPVTGLPDPAADLDFRVTLKDGRFFDVDLAGATTVSDVLTAVNTAATTAGIGVPAEFNADLAADGNGIELTDNTLPVGGTTSVTALNGSHAAEDLGIGGSTTSAVFTGEDRATVAVESVFTHLIELRDALAGNDERGISLATDRLERDISRLAEARAGVGVRSRRVSDAVTREEDLRIQDIALRSEVQDLDYSEAAIRFASLQQQLQAGLTTASRLTDLSLLNFLR
ncbi:MAG: flagellin N-terminal helical domain-containing protein [Planctomycetota bacterium]|jgi:flagellin-like hook-associated protein FlgL